MPKVSAKDKGSVPWYADVIILLTGALYVVSCFLPATCIGSFGNGRGPNPGWAHLAFGWMSGLRGLPAWSANFVLLGACWLLMRSEFRAAALLGILATLLGLTTLTSFKYDGRYAGYYLWQASQFVLAVGAGIAYCCSAKCEVRAKQKEGN
jgi:hypothetical protein